MESPHASQAVRVNALLRYLLCISPWRAESVHYLSNVAPPLNAQGWTRVVAGAHSGWIRIDGEAETGEYSSKRPDLPVDATIPTIEVPARYSIDLRIKAGELVAQAEGGAASPALPNLSDRLLAMGDGRFETAAVADFLQRCATPGWLPGGLAAYRVELLQGHCATRYPGYFAGLMLLLLKSIEGAEAIALTGALLSPQRGDLMGLLRSVLVPLVANDGPGRLELAARDLRAEGKTHFEQARNAARDEAFYGHLFQACPWFYGAARGFELLANQVLDRECEEYLVYASSSLLHHFENLHGGWARWRQHQRRVADLRAAQGEAAAERKAKHYLRHAYFYPGSYLEPLLHGGLAPPEAPGTAGGAALGELCGHGGQ